jgi:hypothetical protein
VTRDSESNLMRVDRDEIERALNGLRNVRIDKEWNQQSMRERRIGNKETCKELRSDYRS